MRRVMPGHVHFTHTLLHMHMCRHCHTHMRLPPNPPVIVDEILCNSVSMLRCPHPLESHLVLFISLNSLQPHLHFRASPMSHWLIFSRCDPPQTLPKPEASTLVFRRTANSITYKSTELKLILLFAAKYQLSRSTSSQVTLACTHMHTDIHTYLCVCYVGMLACMLCFLWVAMFVQLQSSHDLGRQGSPLLIPWPRATLVIICNTQHAFLTFCAINCHELCGGITTLIVNFTYSLLTHFCLPTMFECTEHGVVSTSGSVRWGQWVIIKACCLFLLPFSPSPLRSSRPWWTGWRREVETRCV